MQDGAGLEKAKNDSISFDIAPAWIEASQVPWHSFRAIMPCISSEEDFIERSQLPLFVL